MYDKDDGVTRRVPPREKGPKEMVLRLRKIGMGSCYSDDVFLKVLEVLHISVYNVNSVLQDICVGTLERV